MSEGRKGGSGGSQARKTRVRVARKIPIPARPRNVPGGLQGAGVPRRVPGSVGHSLTGVEKGGVFERVGLRSRSEAQPGTAGPVYREA